MKTKRFIYGVWMLLMVHTNKAIYQVLDTKIYYSHSKSSSSLFWPFS